MNRNIMILLGVLGIIVVFFGILTFLGQGNSFKGLETSPEDASTIVMGASYIKVPENATVVTQVDRVIKDIASNINVKTPPGQSPSSPKDLVPYMEGARVAKLMRYANVKVIPITSVTLKKINYTWYGPDENNEFKFAIDPSKIVSSYAVNGPDENTKIQINTHGMNALVDGAIKNHAYLVVGCGDTPGKVKAEMYMAQHGINVYAPCDRYTAQAMPSNNTGTILGGEPIRQLKNEKGAIIGGQPILIDKKEPIIVQTTTKRYPDQYCDTPERYFVTLGKVYNIQLQLDIVDASIGETYKIVDEAEKRNANIIAVRVLTDKDKKSVENWLKADPNHRAILFHSAPYESGYSLFFEFPQQTTGQDPHPLFIKTAPSDQIQKIIKQITSMWQN
ncbi:MAG: hypothetical protein PHY59_00395 [Methanobacterium sp.]|nr:hypothetical protein [Methanobacterium sp.]